MYTVNEAKRLTESGDRSAMMALGGYFLDGDMEDLKDAPIIKADKSLGLKYYKMAADLSKEKKNELYIMNYVNEVWQNNGDTLGLIPYLESLADFGNYYGSDLLGTLYMEVVAPGNPVKAISEFVRSVYMTGQDDYGIGYDTPIVRENQENGPGYSEALLYEMLKGQPPSVMVSIYEILAKSKLLPAPRKNSEANVII